MRRCQLILLILFGVVLTLQGCTLWQSSRPIFLFGQGEGRCRTDTDEEWASLTVAEGLIRFSGSIATATPCHHLIPAVNRCGSEILLVIQAVPEPGACPLCLGMIDYAGAIPELSPGRYRLRIKHDERVLLDLEVTIGQQRSP